MNERLEKLRATVQELEHELATLDAGGADALDAETRQVLAQAARDIHEALGATAETTSNLASSPSFAARLRDAARDFESTHPTLSGVLERMLDALGQLGI